MNKIRLFSLIATSILAATSVAAHAQHGGGMGGAARAGGDFGGRSGSQISSRGLINSNGPNAGDRDKGRSRAEDRSEMRTGDRHGKVHSSSRKH
ncbi:hypothetical protein AB4156_05740 [Cupriavidus sp. 2MCAB6]|uniref:hypothetical protein n=1 Tax=Cupriavidus sp. 2MCAB6 TaxID=3232981 RepID=UPI003F8E362C